MIPDLERFGPYAREACDGASGILVGSGHIQARLRQAVDDPAINAKVRLGPPGVDTTLFAPIPPSDRPARLRATAAAIRAAGGVEAAAADAGAATSWDRDLDRAADAVEWFAGAEGPRVIYVGKLIVSKGVDLLLAAWPTVHARNPARLLVVGFGAADEVLRDAWSALERGDLGPLRELAAHGRGLEGGEDEPLSMLAAFLADLPEAYADAARAAAGSVEFSGRLEHDEVATPVAASDALVFPSTFPEAFGMVAAEAAAAGALPVSARHRAPPRSAGSWRPTCPPTWRRWSRSTSATTRSTRSPPGSTPGSRCPRPSAAPPARRCGRPATASGAGRASPARCSRRRRASSTTCRSRWRIETPETSAGGARRRRRDQ